MAAERDAHSIHHKHSLALTLRLYRLTNSSRSSSLHNPFSLQNYPVHLWLRGAATNVYALGASKTPATESCDRSG